MSSAGAGAGAADSYDPKTDPARKARSQDPGWKYGYWKDKTKRDVVTCTLCDKDVPGGIKRLKQHLAGGYGDVTLCPEVSSELRIQMEAYLNSKRRRRPLFLGNEEDGDDDDDDDDVVEVPPTDVTAAAAAPPPPPPVTRKTKPSSGTAAKRRHATYQYKAAANKGNKTPQSKKTVADLLRRTPEQVVDQRRAKRHQPSIESSTKTKEERRHVCVQWALWFAEGGVAFNAINSRQFEIACEATAQYGSEATALYLLYPFCVC